jgi:hypothetical protein
MCAMGLAGCADSAAPTEPAPPKTVQTQPAQAPSSQTSPAHTPSAQTQLAQSQTAGVPAGAAVAGRFSLVTGTTARETRVEYARLGDQAVRAVHAALGGPQPRSVHIDAPGTLEEFAAVAGGTPSSLEQVAAVTTGPRDEGGAGPDRIVLNPVAFARLTAQGRQFVLTHESVHVALRTRRGELVPWLSEGLADHVAYAGTHRPRQELAAALLAEVRAGHGLRELPRAADFDPGRGELALTYLAAWLAVEEIADRHGASALLRLVSAATAPQGRDPQAQLESALADVLGTTQAELTAQWLASLQRLSTLSPHETP